MSVGGGADDDDGGGGGLYVGPHRQLPSHPMYYYMYFREYIAYVVVDSYTGWSC